ncbi:MAG: response regulator [Flammeovirgaceae bacterium]|nr:response regulator [Flammeovirgaceae bacterium]MDW8287969.1 response regulator [Flammeovirgaceae bacterium]
MKKPAIICVDDEKIILNSLKTLLKNEFGNQYIIEVSESGEDALELVDELQESEISTVVLISDWLMPQMKGDEFLIKLHKKFPNIKKIMLTGQADPQSVENAKRNADLFKYMTKPWSDEQLLKTVKEALKNTN